MAGEEDKGRNRGTKWKIVRFWVAYVFFGIVLTELIAWTDVVDAASLLFALFAVAVVVGMFVRPLRRHVLVGFFVVACLLCILAAALIPHTLYGLVPRKLSFGVPVVVPDILLGVVVGSALRSVRHELLLAFFGAFVPTIGTYVVAIITP